MRVIAVAAAITLGISASAQIGINADFLAPRFSQRDLSSDEVAGAYGLGGRIGADYDIYLGIVEDEKMNIKFYLTPGLTWSYRTTADFATTEPGSKERLHQHYLNVPVLIKADFESLSGKAGFYYFMGPTFSMGLSSRSNILLSEDGYKMRIKYSYYTGKVKYKVPMGMTVNDEFKDYIEGSLADAGWRHKRFDIGMTVGVGYTFLNRYEIIFGLDAGFSNIAADKLAESYKMTVGTYFIGFRYRFGKEVK